MPEAYQPLIGHYHFKGAFGGRGSGKSHFFAQQLVCECLRQPTRAVCIREIQKSLDDSSKRLIEDKIREMGLEGEFRILGSHIETPNGGVILFRGMQSHTAEGLRSLQGVRIGWADEAHRLSQRSLDILLPTFREEGTELWFSWNPYSPHDPVDKLLRGPAPPPRSTVVEVCYDDNPWFPQSLKELMEYDRRRDIERWKHIWLGTYLVRSGARVFHNWTIEDFYTPSSPEDWEKRGLKERFYFGADWGFASDPTVLVRCWIDKRKLYVDQETWKVGCELDHTPALFDKVPGARFWPIIADSANPQSISYMRRHGFPRMRPSIKGIGSIEEGVEFLKSYDIVVHPRCEHVIEELANYSYEIDRMTDEVLPVLADRKNHTIDALRYALEGLRRATGTAGWSSY